MKMRLVGALAVVGMVGLGTPAKASVVSLFTASPNPAPALTPVDLDLKLTLTADPGYTNAHFVAHTGEFVTINAGNGDIQTWTSSSNPNIPLGTGPDDFDLITSYTDASTTKDKVYTAKYSYDLWYSETGTRFEDFWCEEKGEETFTVTESVDGSGKLKITITPGVAGGGQPVGSVPETSTWVMLVAGFAGAGAVAYRRRSKQQLRWG